MKKHILKVDEMGGRINESSDLYIEKVHQKPYYVVKRLYHTKKGYEWIDEDTTFSTVERAEQHIKVALTQGMRGATNRFQIIMEQQVEFVDA